MVAFKSYALLLTLAGFLFILPSNAAASCSGSGTSWNCTAGSTVAQVQATINSASDGATVTFANGSYTWNSEINLSNSTGVTLICATVAGCTVSTNTTAIGMANTLSGNNMHFYRISGFSFSQSAVVTGLIWIYGTGTLNQLRVDHNTMSGPSGTDLIFLGEQTTLGHFYGVIDHNTINCTNNCTFFEMVGSINNSPPADELGTANNMFLEDNTMTVTAMDNPGAGCIDGWGGDAAIVWRHNTTTNCLVTVHGVTHNGGPASVELYNNTLIVNAGSVGSQYNGDCYRCFHHQGSGMFAAFNNTFTAFSGKNGSVLAMAHYRSYANGPSSDGNMPTCDGTQNVDGNRSPSTTWYGYPCWRQPGRDSFGKYKPMYVWNNFWSDTRAQIPMNFDDFGGSPPPSCATGASGNCDYLQTQIKANREGYNAVSASTQSSPTSPFNGTTGMGFGALANRPTTCTTNSEGSAGVGYFATDQGPQGTLYTCSATNTWTTYYTPYTYPHPLVAGGGGSGQPAPPTGLQASVQ
jgi:hypothetical protein